MVLNRSWFNHKLSCLKKLPLNLQSIMNRENAKIIENTQNFALKTFEKNCPPPKLVRRKSQHAGSWYRERRGTCASPRPTATPDDHQSRAGLNVAMTSSRSLGALMYRRPPTCHLDSGARPWYRKVLMNCLVQVAFWRENFIFRFEPVDSVFHECFSLLFSLQRY